MSIYCISYVTDDQFKTELDNGDIFQAQKGYTIVIPDLQILEVYRNINWDGEIYIDFKTSNLQYTSAIQNKAAINVDSNSPTIGIGDVYEATLCFEPWEIDGVSWIELRMKSIGDTTRRINLQEVLTACPACGERIYQNLKWIDVSTNVMYYRYICTNECCIAKSHLLFSRFTNIVMHSPDLVPFIMSLVNVGYLSQLSDIFTLDINKLKYTFTQYPELLLSKILLKIKYLRGKLSFCDMLRALPSVDYLNSDCWILDKNVYTSFLSPHELINNWMMPLLDMYNFDTNGSISHSHETAIWNSKYLPNVSKFMSNDLFWGIVKYLKLEKYPPSFAQTQLNTLERMGIFMPFDCALPSGNQILK